LCGQPHQCHQCLGCCRKRERKTCLVVLQRRRQDGRHVAANLRPVAHKRRRQLDVCTCVGGCDFVCFCRRQEITEACGQRRLQEAPPTPGQSQHLQQSHETGPGALPLCNGRGKPTRPCRVLAPVGDLALRPLPQDLAEPGAFDTGTRQQHAVEQGFHVEGVGGLHARGYPCDSRQLGLRPLPALKPRGRLALVPGARSGQRLVHGVHFPAEKRGLCGQRGCVCCTGRVCVLVQLVHLLCQRLNGCLLPATARLRARVCCRFIAQRRLGPLELFHRLCKIHGQRGDCRLVSPSVTYVLHQLVLALENVQVAVDIVAAVVHGGQKHAYKVVYIYQRSSLNFALFITVGTFPAKNG
jgi:hypothetical protein